MRTRLLSSAILVAACSSGSSGSGGGAMQCPAIVDEGTDGCKETWSPCPDGHRYEIACVPSATPPNTCTCKIDDVVTTTVTTNDGCSVTESAAAADRLCGFHVQ